eukprot:360908-Chlamydomonas_euryale.AAC.4
MQSRERAGEDFTRGCNKGSNLGHKRGFKRGSKWDSKWGFKRGTHHAGLWMQSLAWCGRRGMAGVQGMYEPGALCPTSCTAGLACGSGEMLPACLGARASTGIDLGYLLLTAMLLPRCRPLPPCRLHSLPSLPCRGPVMRLLPGPLTGTHARVRAHTHAGR